MPRPGLRPYECVRRAWHSDRHQPMRGSIIQQIFRLALETHSSVTKKNKEWQQKLPTVVLKAEEIMYSKANSEAEYMNPETLWDRVNDAVNTIIRRDESSETGELLPPCIEAALNLGCIPVRALRSQRHINPRSYLNPRSQELSSLPPRIVDRPSNARCHHLSLNNSGTQLNYSRATTSTKTTLPVSDSNPRVTENIDLAATRSYPFLYENAPRGCNQLMTMETNAPTSLASVYPLSCGTHYQNEDSQTRSRIPDKVNSSTILVGTPIGTSIPKPAKEGILQNLLSFPGSEFTSKIVPQADSRDTHKKPLRIECDLNLRLGLFSDPCIRMEKGLAPETEDAGSTSSREEGKFNDLPSKKYREFCFFPGRTASNPSEFYSSKWPSEGES
ncbi:hypothetical protein CFOL_v3_25943 [Cephalotus follicularis]|uniref:KIX domain-containing protein n=1 Tax=Cephalotus follicularis TaxID=3775 RepID=A0A1Q3CQT1_CEPFO|nr:hypothetical protein CFOL_v3_25943 [Cephalotus follicularis]